MPLVSFPALMQDARRRSYAVGYFESWNLESLLAVADGAERLRSPVILGFSGIYLPHPERCVHDPLEAYAALGLQVCQRLSVPACLLFNESPHKDWVISAIETGFSLVMYSDETLNADDKTAAIRDLAQLAHENGAAIEGELQALAGVGGELMGHEPEDLHLTDPADAQNFIEQTGIDALAVNIGQVHLHGRRTVRLNLSRLQQLGDISVPLVLHGATSVEPNDLRAAIELGIRKINGGSRLKQAFFRALRKACAAADPAGNPYEMIGSGLEQDVLVAGRMAMQQEVEQLMKLFGSAGKADDWRRDKA